MLPRSRQAPVFAVAGRSQRRRYDEPARIQRMPRMCQVTFEDLEGVQRVVRVEADSLYEAAALAIRALKKAGFIDQQQPGPASRLHVQIIEPVVSHQITVGQLQRWLDRGSSNPNEDAKRKQLREVFTVK
jgi:hypothetical protein